MRVVPRAAMRSGQWDWVVDHDPGGWWLHREAWLQYSLAGRPESVDISFGVEDDEGRVIAVVPLVREGKFDFALGGVPLPCPLFVDVDGSDEAWELAGQHLDKFGQDHMAFKAQPGHSIPVLGRRFWQECGWDTYVVDLMRDRKARWSALRHSYRSLIHRAEDAYVFISCPDLDAVQMAHAIHLTAAGRQTRPLATWKMMATWGAAGHLFVTLAQRMVGGHSCDGFACVLRDKGWAYYMSGATLEPNLSHALLWHAMEAAAAKGDRWFEVGWCARPDDSEKERNIAHFKAGFGGDAWPIEAIGG